MTLNQSNQNYNRGIEGNNKSDYFEAFLTPELSYFFAKNFGISSNAQDSAFFYDSPLSEVFAAYAPTPPDLPYSVLYALNPAAPGDFAEYDYALNFPHVLATSGDGNDRAVVYPGATAILFPLPNGNFMLL